MRLSPLTYIGFATPGFFMALTAIPTYITLQKFYVADLGLSAATVGLVLLLSRLLDAVTDPLIGWISDRTKGRFGRRKPYMILGGLICGLSLWPLLQPGPAVGALYLFTWLSLFYLGAALIQVPYTAWTADLTKDYEARTRLASAGQLALLLGTVAALSTFSLENDTGLQLRVLALMGLIALPMTLLPAILLVQEPKEQTATQSGPFDALALPFILPELKRFALAYALNALGNTLPLTLTLFYAQYVLKGDPGLALLLYFGSAIAFVPVWTYLGNRFGRHRAWTFAIIATTLLQMPSAFLGEGQMWIFTIISIVVGAFLAADFTLPQAMQGDLADLDRTKSGKNRAAAHYALWSLIVNLATALGAAIALGLIGFAGFQEGTQIGTGALTQPSSAVLAIAIGYAGLPALFKIPAFLLMRGYELTKEKLDGLTDLSQPAQPAPE